MGTNREESHVKLNDRFTPIQNASLFVETTKKQQQNSLKIVNIPRDFYS